MNVSILYYTLGAGVIIFLGTFWLLRKYGIRFLFSSLRSLASPKQAREPFHCLRANIRQISPHFYIAQMVFSNKKNAPPDIMSTPSNHSDQEQKQ